METEIYIGATFIFLGITMVIWSSLIVYLGRSCKTWIVLSGIIRETFLFDEHEPGNFGFSFRVVYVYVWEGKEFIGKRIQFGIPSAMTLEQANEMQERYSVGAQVPVRFNPRSKTSVLESGHSPATLMIFGSAIVLLFTGTMILFN